jgi:hypothetical protein
MSYTRNNSAENKDNGDGEENKSSLSKLSSYNSLYDYMINSRRNIVKWMVGIIMLVMMSATLAITNRSFLKEVDFTTDCIKIAHTEEFQQHNFTF